ncbi:MAG: 1-(5-phosphoribosyl)-5-[(5-phosphoribosylamino)methylideneamino]imidazole-4-carboxamide isomerase [Planctomycetes bacterium]|nr:1-(5-phosphoribosyl)-5-[(5-phosphoribosylamino)methylideneamino]imidazole-4-carboxamide isomerase [Planctomycetota bacterium]
MELLPAIDLRKGKCVRLLQGDYDRQIDYGDNPLSQARAFEQAGAKWVHVVDLDGAKSGTMQNRQVIEQIAAKTTLQVEVGGGIRDEQGVAELLDAGVKRVVIGTRGLEDPDWFRQLVHQERFRGRIVLGLDAREGRLLSHGWVRQEQWTVTEMVEKVRDWPLAAIVYTDVDRDGMLKGPNIEAIRHLTAMCQGKIIASGGISSLADVENIAKLPLEGLIVGRALYEGRLDLAEALALVRQTEKTEEVGQ